MARVLTVGRRIHARLRSVVGFSLVIGLLQVAVITPAAALAFRMLLSTSGRPSVGNFEIATFLLSGVGILALVFVGAVTVAAAWLQVAGLLRILGDPPATVGETLRHLGRDSHRLLRLAALQIGTALLVAAPLLFAALLGVKALWGDRDLNGLLVTKPPVFWQGIAVACVPLLVLVVLLVRLFVQWLFALPILIEEPGVRPVEALRRSTQRTRGRRWRLAGALAAWLATAALLGAVVNLVFWAVGGWTLDRTGTAIAAALPVTAALLAAWALATAFVSWMTAALLAGLIDHLHREATDRPPASALPASAPPPRSVVRRGVGALLLLAVLMSAAALLLVRTHSITERVAITAHRAGAVRAPENTVAALRQAIADGADWAEIDVQLTKDDVLVVVHDFDLVRIGGPEKRVAESTFEEIRAIDVGRGLGKAGFEGEKVPTFEEMITAAGDRIRLNVELKPPTPAVDAALTDAVIAALRRTSFVPRARLCSQSYGAIRRAKEAEPALEIGYIAGAAIGDLAQLDVDYLMVNAGMATRRFVRSAHASGIEVHPWTVNDPDALYALLDRHVDNVITDDPAAMRARLGEILSLDAGERLLLRVRDFLAR